MVATSPMQLSSTQNVVSATEKMIFQISCILFINYILYCILYYRNDLISKLRNLSLNLNNQIWLLTTILDMAAPDWDFLEGKNHVSLIPL